MNNQNKKCEVCGDTGYNNKLSGMVLCLKHAIQYKRHGKFIKNTRFEKNDYTISDCGTYATISLYNRNGNKVGETLVDIEDLEKSIEYKLHLKKADRQNENNEELKLNYAIAKINGKNMRLHQIITGKKNIDHTNNNGLDNRKDNLRECTVSNNGMNKRKQSNNKSGVTGIYYNNQNSNWVSQIKINNKRISLGSEFSFDNAVINRLVAEFNLFGKYSNNYNKETKTIQLEYFSHDDNSKTYIEIGDGGQIVKFDKFN